MRYLVIFTALLLASCAQPSAPRIPTLEIVCNGKFDGSRVDRDFVHIIQINGNSIDGIEGKWEGDAITWNSFDGKTKMVFYETIVQYTFEGVEESWWIDHRPVLRYSYKSQPSYLE